MERSNCYLMRIWWQCHQFATDIEIYVKDLKNAVVTFYLLFVIAILDREITEENIFELAVWTMAELAVGIAIAIYQEIISVIVMLLIMGFFVLPMLVKLFRFWQAEKNKI